MRKRPPTRTSSSATDTAPPGSGPHHSLSAFASVHARQILSGGAAYSRVSVREGLSMRRTASMSAIPPAGKDNGRENRASRSRISRTAQSTTPLPSWAPRAADYAPLLGALQQSRVLEHAQMFHEARKRHVVRRRQLGHGAAAVLERSKDLAARTVGERREDPVELVVGILNH